MKIYRSRQVIIVALVTSLFWFLLNIVLLYTYQGSSVLTAAGQVVRRAGEDDVMPVNIQGNLNGAGLPRGKQESRNTRTHEDNWIKQFLKNTFTPAPSATTKHEPVTNKPLKTEIQITGKAIKEAKSKNVFEFDKEPEIRDPQGPGENGQAVVIKDNEKKEETEGFSKHAFNELASKKMSLHRTIPDTREPGCSSKQYPHDLPTTSVIICFHNEAWSTLLRTVHSVIDRSPAHLLFDVILIDDFSTHDYLKSKLQAYVTSRLRKVRIIRNTKREGLIRSRLIGARAAKGEVITFLDAHCEANVGWLEPLLSRIHADRTIVAVPVIDIINSKTFAYQMTPSNVVGGFSWDMQFSWHSLPYRREKDRKDKTGPIRKENLEFDQRSLVFLHKPLQLVGTPTMAGGLFSINRNYFFESGSYDGGMDLWGGENLEMSFRIWQCGGKLEIIPCSRVGHVFRSRFPYSFPGGYTEVSVNLARVVRVWMDKYDKFVYMKRPDLRDLRYGDITSRKELRKRLQCKSFKWYLENIYPEQTIPGEDAQAYGEIRNTANRMCVDTMGKSMGGELGYSLCHGMGGNQLFYLKTDGQLQSGDELNPLCVEALGEEILLMGCDITSQSLQWKTEGKSIYHKSTKKCLESKPESGTFKLNPCNGSSKQEWVFSQKLSSGLR